MNAAKFMPDFLSRFFRSRRSMAHPDSDPSKDAQNPNAENVFGDLDPLNPTQPSAVSAEDVEAAVADATAGMEEADELTKALQDAAYFRDLATRSAAELDNFRKRMAREKQDAVKFANLGLLETILPVLDNFDFGLQAAKAENEGSSIFLGMSMVYKQLQDFLRDQGVEEISTVGVPFDASVHDAVSQMPSADAPEGTILQQVRRGYRLRERLLRPASVIVASAPQA
jgi:molecular chaperone GrpE